MRGEGGVSRPLISRPSKAAPAERWGGFAWSNVLNPSHPSLPLTLIGHNITLTRNHFGRGFWNRSPTLAASTWLLTALVAQQPPPGYGKAPLAVVGDHQGRSRAIEPEASGIPFLAMMRPSGYVLPSRPEPRRDHSLHASARSAERPA